MLTFLNRTIRWSFYSIFLLVPLALWPDTSELFEFNKLWLTYIFAIIIGCAWICKMIQHRRIYIQRTPLDIPIILFLVSQIISTVFSWDPYVSWWGYYSRFNGGLLSIITYIFLYYAFVSNISFYPSEKKKFVLNCLKVSLFSGLIAALWGLPSHFGYDPTCLIFRGQLNVDCWTSAFQPQIRMFSTLGQPDWFAAYLSILIPITLVFGILNLKKMGIRNWIFGIGYLALTGLFYVDFLYTRSKGSFIAQIISFTVLFGGIFILNVTRHSGKRGTSASRILPDNGRGSGQARMTSIKILLLVITAIIAITFFLDTPFVQLQKFTWTGLQAKLFSHQSTTKQTQGRQSHPSTGGPNTINPEIGGTDSGKIRTYVWAGAIDAWMHYPLIGTGVETFAYAYYRFRPVGHNLTSEWDYLYNKAHNEYLNYLATTGIFGLGTYLAIIGVFLGLTIKYVSSIDSSEKYVIHNTYYLILALISAYLSIIISNFFGFSVVIVNIYFFMIPAFVFVFCKHENNQLNAKRYTLNAFQSILMFLVAFIGIYLILVLFNYWQSDRSYGLGTNLDHAGAQGQATAYLRNAVASRPDEPVYKDELSNNDATLALSFATQKDPTAKTNAQQLAQEAIQLSDDVVTNHPNSLVYWKTRIKIFYILSQLNASVLPLALSAAQKAAYLAPTDAKISYNLGLLYAQNNNIDKGIEVLNHTIQMKPDYRDAYYALGILLHQKAIDKNGKVTNVSAQEEAVKNMRFLLQLSPTDKQAIDMLKSWGETP